MEYEYKEAGFKKASEAVIAFENGTELFLMNAPCMTSDNFNLMNIYGVCANFDALYTMEEKAIDFEKEFTIDTPWMLKNDGEREDFAYALMYDTKTKLPYKFRAFDDEWTAINATEISNWKFARRLTKEEEIKYLGDKK